MSLQPTQANNQAALAPTKRLSIFLQQFKPQLAKALGQRNVDQEISAILAVVSSSPALQKCSPESIALAAYDAATIGLPVNKLGLVWIVPYGNEAKMQIGFKGYIQLAIESGYVLDISADCVYENDRFKYILGSKPFIEHEPTMSSERGKLVAVYAVARLVNGLEKPLAMSKSQIDFIRSKSRSGNGGPWNTDYDEMAKKTVIKRLCKQLPCVSKLDKIIQAEQLEDDFVSQENSPSNSTIINGNHRFIDTEIEPK